MMIRRSALAVAALTVIGTMAMAQSKPAEPLKTFTVVVVDADTQKPLSAFDYRYHVAAPGGDRADVRGWTATKSEAGAVKLDLPASCELLFDARAAGYVYDTFYMTRYEIKAGDDARQATHVLHRGITVTGRVIDAATSQPVAGVRVSPTVFCNPSSKPDHDRSVFSNADGQFEISGINPGLGSIEFEHTDYLVTQWYARDFESHTTRPASGITVQLEAGNSIFGVVRGPDGKPIPGAVVNDGDGKTVQTGADGSFRIRGVRKHWGYGDFYVQVKQPGYMEYWRTPHEMPADGFQITLDPLFEIRGRVVDPNGQPVKSFAVMAGPGSNPEPFRCAYASVTDEEGRFSIAIDTLATWLGGVGEDGKHVEARHWLAVWRDGDAVWEDLVPFDRAGAVVSVALRPGVAVSGRLSGIPANFEGGEAVLVPERTPHEYSSEETAPQKVGALTTPIGADGALRFVHVRPDRYTLRTAGRGITPRRLTAEVQDEDLDVGSIDVQATGRIVGQIFTREGKPWAFADGVLYHPALGRYESRTFKATEDGRFVLDDVPAGEARVGAQYLGGDMIESDLVNVNVVPGDEVRVVVNEPNRTRDAKFRIVIGDDSDAQRKTGTGMGAERLVTNVTNRDPAFRIELQPTTTGAITMPDMSDWLTPDADRCVVLPDVPPGKYRMRVFDWLLSRGFRDGLLYEADIEARPGAEPFRVPLGAGAITGQLKVSKRIRRMPQVIAIETHGRTHPRRARCDGTGNFCVRYLPAGEYALFGHEDANGYCLLPPVRVSADIADVGEHALVAGATIRGEVRIERPAEPPTDVFATDTKGVKLPLLDFIGLNGERYAISGLWPGSWTLTLERDGQVLSRKIVKLEGTESVTADLTIE